MFLAIFNIGAALLIGFLVFAAALSFPGTVFRWAFWAGFTAFAIVLFATFLTGLGD